MPKNKNSQTRINCLVRLMKEKKYPNYPMLIKEMKKLDIAGAYEISQKTIQRDVAFLKNVHKAPIKYDAERKGYYLYSECWENIPPFTEAVEMDAALFGAHLAETIFPPSKINRAIRTGTDALWSRNQGTCDYEMTTLNALVAHGSRTKIDPEIFQTVFEAWQKKNDLQIRYKRSGDGRILDMHILPHVLTLYDNVWYLRAQLLQKEVQPFLTLALQRIISADNPGGSFEPDSKVIQEVNDGFLFDLPRLPEVKLHLRNGALNALEYLTPVEEAKQPDGSVIVTLQGIEEYRIFNLVLTSCGNAIIIFPDSLKQKAIEMSTNFINQQKGTFPDEK